MFPILVVSLAASDTLLHNVIPQRFQVEFTYDYHEGEKIVKVGEGRLSVEGKKYKVELPEREITYNGKTLWNFDKEKNTVTIAKDDIEDNIFTLFLHYQKFFTQKDVKQNGDLFTVTMIPREDLDEPLDIRCLEIVCDEEVVHEVHIFNEDDTRMLLRFQHWDLQPKFTAKFFYFNIKQKDVHVIKLD